MARGRNLQRWTCLTLQKQEESLRTLEELQNMFLTKLLRTKCTTPKLALTFETGMLPMKDGVAVKKLRLVNDLGFGRKE